MSLTDPLVLVLLLVVLLAAVVNGTIGFGFAILAVNALAFVLGAREGIVVQSLLSVPLAVLQLVHHREMASGTRRIALVLATAVVGSLVGARLLTVLPGPALSLGLGLFTAWFAFERLRTERPPISAGVERRFAPIAGFSAGVANGALGASGPLLGTYLTAIGLRGRDFAFAINLGFCTMGIARAATLAWFGQYSPTILGLGLLLLVPSVIGQRLGFWFQGRLPATTLQRAILVALLVASANLLFRASRDILGFA